MPQDEPSGTPGASVDGDDAARPREFRERLDRQRSEFVSKVSHELRNPLATIRGLASLMADGGREIPGAERARFAEAIVRQADHLAKLVDDIILVSHMDAGESSYAHIEFDARRLLEETVAEARAAHPAHTIDLLAPDSLPALRGDPERLAQALANLLENACRYSDEGSTVTIRAAAGTDRMTIAVEDHGAGIGEDERPMLFKRFSRIPRAGGPRGTGLGLYIARGIVEAHGGEIELSSEKGRGSTFRVILPVGT